MFKKKSKKLSNRNCYDYFIYDYPTWIKLYPYKTKEETGDFVKNNKEDWLEHFSLANINKELMRLSKEGHDETDFIRIIVLDDDYIQFLQSKHKGSLKDNFSRREEYIKQYTDQYFREKFVNSEFNRIIALKFLVIFGNYNDKGIHCFHEKISEQGRTQIADFLKKTWGTYVEDLYVTDYLFTYQSNAQLKVALEHIRDLEDIYYFTNFAKGFYLDLREQVLNDTPCMLLNPIFLTFRSDQHVFRKQDVVDGELLRNREISLYPELEQEFLSEYRLAEQYVVEEVKQMFEGNFMFDKDQKIAFVTM